METTSIFASHDTLSDCGITDTNLKMQFPRVVVGRWATMRRNVKLSPNDPDAYTAEMTAIENAPSDEPLQMTLQSNLEPLRNSLFIIEKFEYYAFDKTGEMLPNWQPNHFVPSLIVNQEELVGGGGKMDGLSPINQANIGLVLPYCLSFEAPFNPLQSITVNAQLKRKDAGNVLRNVPVVALGTFRYRA
jgi:hypothetical protein